MSSTAAVRTCALTVRTLRPGTFEQFREAFMTPIGDEAPAGWSQFAMLRGTANPDEVVCLGIFEGDAEALRASTRDEIGREEQQEAIRAFVLATGTDDLFEVVELMRA